MLYISLDHYVSTNLYTIYVTKILILRKCVNDIQLSFMYRLIEINMSSVGCFTQFCDKKDKEKNCQAHWIQQKIRPP